MDDWNALHYVGIGVVAYLGGVLLWLLVLEWRNSVKAKPALTIPSLADAPLLHMSSVELADAIRRGAVSSLHVVNAHLDQLDQAEDAGVNCVTERFAAEARHTAASIDELLNEERELGGQRAVDVLFRQQPLLGVPMTVKECFSLAGKVTTGGLLSRAKPPHRTLAPGTAPPVQRLLHAGAVLIGRTNLSEVCMWWESSNPVFGRTRNPHALTRIVGGSSGGEAAAVAAAGSPAGLGSDIGGSIRMPAAFCGVFGLKPTPGLIPNTGQFPTGATSMMCTGPIARRAEDLWPLLCICAGDDGRDPVMDPRWARAGGRTQDLLPWADAQRSLQVLSPGREPVVGAEAAGEWEEVGAHGRLPDVLNGTPDDVQLDHIRVLRLSDDTLRRHQPLLSPTLQPEVEVAIGQAAHRLNGIFGCRLDEEGFHMPELRHAFSLWESTLETWNVSKFAHMLLRGDRGSHGFFNRQCTGTPAAPPAEEQQGPTLLQTLYLLFDVLVLAPLGLNAFTVPAAGLAFVEPLIQGLRGQAAGAAMAAETAALAQRLQSRLHNDGVLLMPAHPTTAPVHDLPLFRIPAVGWTSLVNALELPSVSVPIGRRGPDGMPMALQVVAAPGNDHLCCAVAMALERVMGGWVRPGAQD